MAEATQRLDDLDGHGEQTKQRTLPGDHQLRELILLVDRGASRFPITLTVSGLVITGWLASGREYMAYFAQQFSSGMSDEGRNELVQEFRERAERVYPFPREDDTPAALMQAAENITYIHIRDARIISPMGQSIPPTAGSWWRGRLAAIDGFFYGAMDGREDGA